MFFAGPTLANEHVDEMLEIPWQEQHDTVSVLVPFLEKEEQQNARLLLEQFSRGHDLPTAFLARDALLRIIAARNPQGEFKQQMLIQINLAQVSPFTERVPCPITCFLIVRET